MNSNATGFYLLPSARVMFCKGVRASVQTHARKPAQPMPAGTAK
jgi:hypothetical protein